MFTGIISDLGTVVQRQSTSQGTTLCIRASHLVPLLQIGSSIAVNGCCLTATALTEDTFEAYAMPETLSRTNLGDLAPDNLVNLERPLALGGTLDGHLVTGHIDGLARITSILPAGDSFEITLTLPEDLMRYMVVKGSIALDGISLTIARIQESAVTVCIIPHTYQVTIVHTWQVGTRVHVEADIIAKHLARLSQPYHI